MRQWTDEERKKQAEAIKNWKPWEKSTGPRTSYGKNRSALNALKTGERSVRQAQYATLFRLNRDFIRLFKKLNAEETALFAAANKLLSEKEKP